MVKSHGLWRLPWLAATILGLYLIYAGLGQTFYIGPPRYATVRAGNEMIMVGSLFLLAAAAWGQFLGLPSWISIAVSLPALGGGIGALVGGSNWGSWITLIPLYVTIVSGPLALIAAAAAVLVPRSRRRNRIPDPGDSQPTGSSGQRPL